MDKKNNNKELTENEDIFKNCPYCSEKILLNAIKCKYCGEWLNKKEKKEKRKKKIGKMFLNFFLYFIIYFVISVVIKAIFFSKNPDVTGKMLIIDILVILTVIVSFFIIKKAKKNDEYYVLLLLLLAVVVIVFISIIRKGQAISFKVNTSMFTSDDVSTSIFTSDDVNTNIFMLDEKYKWLSCGDDFYDRRNNEIYSTIVIGEQCWFQENLNIGVQIDVSRGQSDNTTIEKYCYDNDSANCDIYGGLYEWDESMDYSLGEGAKGICPDGWHIPTDNDWRVLIDYLGSEAGSKLAGRDDLWNDGLLKQSDYFGGSGFNALPAGFCYENDRFGGDFNNLGSFAYFWSSSEGGPGSSWNRGLRSSFAKFFRNNVSQSNAFSVRCLKN